MIEKPRSSCPINRAIEMLGDQWSLLILRDIAMYDRRSFGEILNGNEEGISAPVLSRRLSDLVGAGFLVKSEASRGKQGRYSLTERSIRAIPLLVELAQLGAYIDPDTAASAPAFSADGPESLSDRMDALRRDHL